MLEVIYISPSCKQAEDFIYGLAENLKQSGISNFETNMRRLYIRSNKFIVSVVNIFGGLLGVNSHITKYYIDKISDAYYQKESIEGKALMRLKTLKRSFREGMKEISEEELIEILTEVSTHD